VQAIIEGLHGPNFVEHILTIFSIIGSVCRVINDPTNTGLERLLSTVKIRALDIDYTVLEDSHRFFRLFSRACSV
jgi:hypothetical protein